MNDMPASAKHPAQNLEARREILKARAQALAREPKIAAEPEGRLEVLEFVLANERYALETAFVREVCALKELTPLPCTPSFILGIINIRGQILAVTDLKRFFHLPDKGLSDLNKVIILRRGGLEVGILADRVSGVRAVSVPEVQEPLPTLEGLSPDYLKGISREALIILDAEKILTDPRMIVHEEVELPSK